MSTENSKYIGISYPFTVSAQRFLKLDAESIQNVKSKIVFLLSTKKGSRIYHPEFGLNLEKYLFEPLDQKTIMAIKQEIQEATSKFIGNVQIESIETKQEGNKLIIGVSYLIKDGTFSYSDSALVTI